ncbi:MAG: phosphohistidine phosphatase SixA [bacterium]
MKNLILIRHAKSNQNISSVSDKERPLNARGKKAAPFMAEYIKKKGVRFDLLISSPAERAYSTAKKFADIFEYNRKEIKIVEELYGAAIHEILDVIHAIDDKHNCVALVGHNPDLTQFNNYMVDTFIDNIPTCGIASLEFDINSWKDIEQGVGKLLFFEYPKKLNPLL